MPYVHALEWYTDHDGPGRRRLLEAAAQGRQLDIHIVTDSDVIARCGNRPESRRSHKPLWAAIDAHVAKGYHLTFHHVPRSVSNINVLVDEISRQARICQSSVWKKSIEALQKRYPGLPGDVTIYDFS